DGLHVVMGIKEYRRLAGSPQPLTVGIGVGAARAQGVYVLQTGLAHLLASERCRLADLLLMLAVGADARNGNQVGQSANQGSMILRQPIQNRLHEGSPRLVRCTSFVEPRASASADRIRSSLAEARG